MSFNLFGSLFRPVKDSWERMIRDRGGTSKPTRYVWTRDGRVSLVASAFDSLSYYISTCVDVQYVAQIPLPFLSSQIAGMCIAIRACGTQPRTMITSHVVFVVTLSRHLNLLLAWRIESIWGRGEEGVETLKRGGRDATFR